MSDKEPPDGGGGAPPDIDILDCSQDINVSLQQRSALKRPADSDSSIESKKNRPPSDSIQSVFSKPGFETNSKLSYNECDRAPFTVFVSKIEPDPATGTTLKVLKFAQFLHKNNVKGISEGGIKSLGRNKLAIDFKTASEANSFVESDFLTSNNYSAKIPRFHVTRMGIVRDIPTDWTLEDLVSGVETPRNCGEVIRARRLNFKNKKGDTVTWSPSSTVVLTFAGQTLPERVFCYNASLPVSVYHLPTIQCRNCLRFGHIRSQCRSKARCFKCAQPHPGDSCDVPDSQTTCILCDGGNHKATDEQCPEHSRQKNIKMVMSQENLSYSEASARFPRVKRFYSNVTANSPQYHSTQATAPDFSQLFATPLLSPSSTSASPSKTSYTKTVFRSPRPRPELGKSYDVQAHRSIVSSPNSAQPNGCALQQPPNTESTPLCTPNDNLIELLTCSLINILSKFSDAIPNNVLILVEQLLQSWIRRNAKDPSME
nr:uncharacterized protein LOC126057037 [Helicoverpa armigera]